MMIEGLPGFGSASPADPEKVEKFLDDFNQKCVEFGYFCDRYMREEIGIGDITRHLSEATADAELKFGEYSLSMTLEQLQRYGVVQNTLDNMTIQLFETEIKRNRYVISEAIKNGEYFIIGLTYNSIKSSIYMMYSKNKIKIDQDRALSELEQELEATQSMIKVLKAIEATIKVQRFEDINFQKIQKALDIYANYFKNAVVVTKAYCDERIFRVFDDHVEFLRNNGFGGDAMTAGVHLSICCDSLQSLAKTDNQRQKMAYWRTIIDV